MDAAVMHAMVPVQIQLDSRAIKHTTHKMTEHPKADMSDYLMITV
jgi:hypothetical protein